MKETIAYLCMKPSDLLETQSGTHRVRDVMPGIRGFLPIYATREGAEKYAGDTPIHEVVYLLPQDEQ